MTGGHGKRFLKELAERNPDPGGRRWLFVPEDQLTARLGPLSREDPASVGVVLVESGWKMRRRPYHRQKLALLKANLRQFALEQAARGVAVRHVVAEGPYHEVLAPIARELGPLRMMRPAERELRVDLAPLVRSGAIEELPHEGWLTTIEQFAASAGPEPPWKMDAFYRHVRKKTGILMEGGKPVGGKISYDTENRKRWPGEPPAAEPPTFAVDRIKEEVGAEVEAGFSEHPGRLDLSALPATLRDAEALWQWALESCLPHFGPYQDAMSDASRTLFHTRISPLVNIHRLLPARVVADAEAAEAPLASREGFIRQVIGWREFVRHVHELTDGFRERVDGKPSIAITPGDGGYARWADRPWLHQAGDSAGADEPDGGAAPSHLGSDQPLPVAWWGVPSGLRCLDESVKAVWDEAYGHHIARLMVLANLATLLDVSPRELTDWFWIAYADAYDWVVEPNVLGMGTYAVGPLMTTKPYVSGAAYIDRMSDHCRACAFHPKKTCPITPMYWDFLRRHREQLQENPRLKMPYRSLAKRSGEQQRRDRDLARAAAEALRAGRTLSPDAL